MTHPTHQPNLFPGEPRVPAEGLDICLESVALCFSGVVVIPHGVSNKIWEETTWVLRAQRPVAHDMRGGIELYNA